MKKLKIILIALGLLAGSFAVSTAATCTNVFPVSLNGYTSGACIPSAWGNALEAKLGITGSAATSSLDYQINHIFTSYGSEVIASSAIPWINYSNASLPSSTYLVSSTPIVNTFNGGSGTRTYGVTSANPFISVATSSSNATLTFSSSSLNLGTISSFASTDYLPSSTAYVSSINGGSAGAYSIKGGTNVSISTTTTSTIISVTNTSTAASGSSGDVQFNNNGVLGADSGNFDYSSSSKQLTLSTPTSSVVIGSSAYFATSTVTTVVSESYSGATSSFTVPSGITSLIINAIGGGAGNGTYDGGATTGTLSVTGGQVIYYAIGQGTTGQTGGYPGGGTGNNGGNDGGGGGMTWISTSTSFSTSTVILVAGGAGSNGNAVGGAGGGTTGSNGGTSGSGGGGQGGTQSAGGTGGTGSPTGGAGSAGQGGSSTNGGGGGAGYFGGGGGGGTQPSAGGGGGGSSYMASSLTSTSTGASSNTGNGSITFTYSQTSTSLTQQNFGLAVGNEILTGGSSPSLSSCGTSPSLVVGSTNTAGEIITGGGSISSCTLNFSTSTPYSNPAYFTAPFPLEPAVSSGTAQAYKVVTTTSTAIFTPAASVTTGTIFSYFFIGH